MKRWPVKIDAAMWPLLGVLLLLIGVAVFLSGCLSAGVTRRTETHQADGSFKVSETRISSFALYEDGLRKALDDAGTLAGGLWEAIPDSLKTAGLGLLGVGGVGYHVSRVRKHKEKSFNKALSLRLGPPEIKAGGAP